MALLQEMGRIGTSVHSLFARLDDPAGKKDVSQFLHVDVVTRWTNFKKGPAFNGIFPQTGKDGHTLPHLSTADQSPG